MGLGRVYGWVVGGYTGVLPSQLESGGMYSEAGPVGPARAGVGGTCCSARPSPQTTHSAALRGPLRCLRPLPASWPIRARFHQLFSKVSQNRRVSPKCMHKACHSPYIQNGLQKSALQILRFPFSAAFSHKELMGQFEAYLGLYCQNDEVSTVCTRTGTRRGRSIPPRSHAASCLCVTAPH